MYSDKRKRLKSAIQTMDESLGSDNERDLTKVDEETFLEDLLPIETTLMELATFAPSRSRNLTGDIIGSLGNLEKLQLPMNLFLFPNTPCLRNMRESEAEEGVAARGDSWKGVLVKRQSGGAMKTQEGDKNENVKIPQPPYVVQWEKARRGGNFSNYKDAVIIVLYFPGCDLFRCE
ncbi:hypothetical protein CR513_14346, partial [Mucuna pruriens]